MSCAQRYADGSRVSEQRLANGEVYRYDYGFDAQYNIVETIVMMNVIPYPLSLDSPPVRRDFSERRLVEIASASPIETTVHLCMCRQRLETLIALLRPRSLLVIGGHKSWWPTKEEKLARELRRAGHEVILAESN